MTRLQWGAKKDKLVQGGIDRAVIYPKADPAVVWNGLVSVVESGSQETSTYYVDGRRFLTSVTPREYSAKITAITFPDAFAELCGIVEAADGLFLDSQVPDQFCLSYRTMSGNNDPYYKIHLIYGVTAAMSDVTFNSLSDNSDLTEFEFDITGVPESINGFRPTAHVIIDTRNLDTLLVEKIENILYGTFNVDPSMPTIQSLFEMMNFGDIVVIRDNGDGTWSAEGSYKYITLDPDTGEFTVDNVTVNDHGDGTYDVASTNETIV